jgi:DNA-binding IclR family transcriptional regulator
MHRGKVHRYLTSMARAGLVARGAQAGHYEIGPLAVSAGLAGLNRLEPIRLAYDALPALRDRIGETVVLAVWGERGATVIALEDSARPVTLNVRVGSILPTRTSAVGQVFAAYRSEAAPRSGRAPRGMQLARVLERVRRDGIASVEGTLIPGLNAIAAPIFDQRGKLVLVIGVVGRRETLSASPTGKAARALIAEAAELSRRLGNPGSVPATRRSNGTMRP